MAGSLGLVFRLVRRELRASIAQFAILIACIALGVAAIVAVISLSRGLVDGLSREGRLILGADASFTLIQREANADEVAALARHGTVSMQIASRAMVRTLGDESTIVELKAVQNAYPIAGSIGLEGRSAVSRADVHALLANDAAGLPGLIVDPLLTGRLGIAVGERVRIGDGTFRIAAHLTSEPDKLSAGFGFGPRVLMSEAAIRETGLIQPGSLTRFSYHLDLGSGVDDQALTGKLDEIAKAVPEAGWRVVTRMRASPSLERQIGRFTQFLSLVGLTSLLIGGVGVANATRAFAEKQVPRIATLKSLGASSRFVFASALAQVLAFALIGIAIGLVLGSALPQLAIVLAGDLLPFPLRIGLYPRELLLGLAYGVVTALTFALWPLLRARAVPPSVLFRDDVSAPAWRPRLSDILLVLIAVLSFGALVVETAAERRFALVYLAAAGGAIFLLRGVAWLVTRLAAALPRPANPILRVALANLHRPGSLTPTVILSLGLGLMLIVALTLIDTNLVRQFRSTLPGLAPSFFFIDIPSRDIDRFDAFLRQQSPDGKVERVPQLRGRLVEIRGIPAAQYRKNEDSWVLDGDRGITYSAKPPDNARLVEGEWWPADYRGTPLVSFAKDVADNLGIGIGDMVTVNVLGRRITARIANLREIRWQQIGINFIMVFSPNTFAGAPHTFLATVILPPSVDTRGEIAIARAVARDFPAISAVRVKDAIAAADSLVSQLVFAIRTASAIALISSVLVLGGALAASARTRQQEGIILKTLGATRATLLKAMIAEYSALGAIAVLFGIVCGVAGASLVVSGVMGLEFELAWWPTLSMAFSAFIATIILGLIGTWHILGQKPAPYLRHA
ncbi:COG3127 Predicted ABC-type transport system involved in lysophospholipase L1 biosynthesis, permease component [Rhabdaerophilaceae bacterium]